MTLRRADFSYALPPELIAQSPPRERAGGRMLVLDPVARTRRDAAVRNLVAELRADDLLVFNDTRVIPARLHGRKDTGGAVEILIERVQDERRALAQVRASKTPRAGSTLLVGDSALTVLGREGEFFALELAGGGTLEALLEREGAMPLPPYIEREAAEADRERYQTVFARTPGAVAAPTAGLHFDAAMLEAIRARGIADARVTLHVGAGTFQPMRVDDIARHRMHRERLDVPEETVAAIAAARARGGRVVAVGTTVVRSLETAALGGELRPYRGETDIFITPGFRFRAVDALLTNFHLPESTLLMLVSAFAGREFVLESYRHAVVERYRFFSYGDAMFIAGRAP